jgi:hypothetical protein
MLLSNENFDFRRIFDLAYFQQNYFIRINNTYNNTYKVPIHRSSRRCNTKL